MANTFPGSLNNYPTGSNSLTLASMGHVSAHNAYEAKIGIGSSTPVINTVLRGTGTGSSSWAQVNLTTDVTGVLPGANGGTGVVTLTQPATAATLTIVNNKTLTASNTLTLAGTDGTTITFQGSDTYVGRTTTDTLTNKTLTSPKINVGSDAQGDIHYRDGSGNFARLAPGTSGNVLQTNGAGANPSWASSAVHITGYQVNPADGFTTASASFGNITGGTQSITISATSHIWVQAQAAVSNATAATTTYIRTVYNDGSDHAIGPSQGYVTGQTSDGTSIPAGGVKLSLAAGTYTIAMQAKVSAGTGTYNAMSMAIVILPA